MVSRQLDFVPHLATRRPWTFLLALAILTFPLSSALSVANFSFSEASFPGANHESQDLKGIFLENIPATKFASISGVSKVNVEFRDNALDVGPVGLESAAGTSSFETDGKGGTVDFLGFTFAMIVASNAIVSSHLGDSMLSSVDSPINWERALDSDATPPVLHQSGFSTITGEAPNISIMGDFTLSLWNAEVAIEDQIYWAGTRIVPFDSEPSILSENGAGKSREQVLHVHVKNGSFSLTGFEHDATIVSGASSLSGDAGILLENAVDGTGHLLGTVETHGEWSFNLEAGDELTAKGFEAVELTVGGQIVTSTSMSWLWWMLGIASTVGFALLYRQTSTSHIRRMESELSRGDYAKVAKHRLRGLLRSKHAGKASLYRSTSLLAMGLFQEATLFLTSLEPRSRPDPATYHFLQAPALAGVGSKHEASKHLLDCLSIAPSYSREAEAIPMMRELMGRIGVARSMMDDQYV